LARTKIISCFISNILIQIRFIRGCRALPKPPRFSAALTSRVLPLETPLDDIPEVAVMDSEAKRLRTGQAIHLPQLGEGVVLITTAGKPVALGWLEEGELRPKRVFNL